VDGASLLKEVYAQPVLCYVTRIRAIKLMSVGKSAGRERVLCHWTRTGESRFTWRNGHLYYY